MEGIRAFVPRVRWRRPKCDRITPPHPLSWPCVSDLLLLKRRELLRAVTLDDSTPQCRISELRVWSYEPFIVPASSSSGYTSGQNYLDCKSSQQSVLPLILLVVFLSLVSGGVVSSWCCSWVVGRYKGIPYILLSCTGLPWTCPVVLACHIFLIQLESSAIE